MIQSNALLEGFLRYQKEFEDKAVEVLRSGWYILGKEVQQFEEEFAAWVGASYGIGVASGLDALTLAFRALGIGEGDEVLVQGNTFIAGVMGISINGATPVFVEPDIFYNLDPEKLEEKITNKTKAILATHLYGQASDMKTIVDVCQKHGLKLVEDCAQSHGATFNGKTTGTFGDAGCFSFYPTKNLGAFGDGGAVVTNNEELAKTIKMLRNYGSEVKYHNKEVGMNSRLDELQAGLLRIRLSHLDELIEEKRRIAERYLAELKNDKILLPQIREGATHVWHQFVIRTKERDALKQYLEEHDIETLIHYPIPPHRSEAYRYLGYAEGSMPITERYANEVLSIPMYNGLTDDDQTKVIRAINEF